MPTMMARRSIEEQAPRCDQPAGDSVHAARRSMEAVMAAVSHELRQPLNAILGWASVWRSGRLDEARQRQSMEAIERNARVLARLVDDLCDTAAITSGRLRVDVQPIDVSTAVAAAVDVVAQAAAAKGVQLELDLAPGVRALADADRLGQIVWNLVANAITFTPPGGSVLVQVRLAGGRAVISVADTGQGIGPELLPHVFERYRQASAGAPPAGSFGLGLAIVKHLVELHGGAVAADSAGECRGATFTVRLPALVDAARPASPRATEGAARR
jgi:signal transduction histidine kinase